MALYEPPTFVGYPDPVASAGENRAGQDLDADFFTALTQAVAQSTPRMVRVGMVTPADGQVAQVDASSGNVTMPPLPTLPVGALVGYERLDGVTANTITVGDGTTSHVLRFRGHQVLLVSRGDGGWDRFANWLPYDGFKALFDGLYASKAELGAHTDDSSIHGAGGGTGGTGGSSGGTGGGTTTWVQPRPPLVPRFDDFRAASGTTMASRTRSASGHSYQSGFAASAGGPTPTASDSKIEQRADGLHELRLLTSGADYYWTTAAHDIDEAAMTFAFRPGGSTKNAGVCLAIGAKTGPSPVGVNGVFTNAVHISIAPDIMRITLTDGATGTLMSFESGDVRTTTLGLPTDGTPITVIAKRTERDRIRFTIPGYFDAEVTDSRIPSWWGSTIGVEHLRPHATLATDAEPTLLPWRSGPLAARRPSASPAVAAAGASGSPMGGIPWAVPSAAPAAAAFSAGYTRYWPVDLWNPIVLASALLEVTTASGTAGSRASLAILAADASWQPRALLADLGVVATDSVGVKSLTGLSVALAARRVLVGMRLNVAATMRFAPYQIPGASNQRTSMGATPFVQCLGVAEGWAASWSATPTQWTDNPITAVPGWVCPAMLTWTEP